MQELFDGLEARGQNAWPNVRHDIGAVLGLFRPLFQRWILLQDIHGPATL